jgi:hypothetical protein
MFPKDMALMVAPQTIVVAINGIKCRCSRLNTSVSLTLFARAPRRVFRGPFFIVMPP